jgi:cell division protein FtsW
VSTWTRDVVSRDRAAGDPLEGRQLRGPERERHEPDHWILVPAILLCCIGLLMVYSSAAAEVGSGLGSDPLRVILPELGWLGMGAILLVVLGRLDYRVLRVASVPLFLTALVLLLLPLLPFSLGPIRPVESGGAHRWVLIGGLQMHPAEVAKLALVVYLAHWMTRRGHDVASFARGTMPFLAIAGIVIALVAIEPDLGTTAVVTLTAFTIFFVAGARLSHLAALVPMGLVALGVYVSLRAYQMSRLEVFFNPWQSDPDASFHTLQALYALAMGGLFGSGLGQSRQPGGIELPNAHNDFVFAMVGQELGLLGAVAVIGLFVLFTWRAVRTALRAPDTFGALLAMGIAACLGIQAFINIGVVVNLLPLTGITLPFVSSGGTSLVVSLAMVGILLSISRETVAGDSLIDAHPGRSRGNGRTPVPGAGRPAVAGRAPT